MAPKRDQGPGQRTEPPQAVGLCPCSAAGHEERGGDEPWRAPTLRIFTTTFSLLVMLMASKTSLYLPRPSFRTSW